jgi:hypothetical protein
MPVHFRGFRFQVALLVFLVVSALGLGVKYLHQQTKVLDPLIEQIQGVPGVVDVRSEQSILDRTSRVLLTLQVEQDSRLAVLFPRVYQTLLAQGGTYGVRVEDAPNSALLEVFQRVQIAVEEAIVTGEFTALETRVKQLADEAGLAWELGLDREFIYLSLVQGESTLRRIVSRGVSEGRVRVYTDGGVTSWPNG